MACCAAARAADDTPRWGMAGGDKCLWVYCLRTDATSGKSIPSFAFRPTSDKSGEFLGVPTPGLGGNIAWAVANGEAVHLIFRDGTHRSLRVRQTSVMRIGDEHVELPLPQNAVPLALGPDSTTGILYALVPGVVAAELPRPQAVASADSESPTTVPVEAEPQGSISPALVQYVDGKWLQHASLPPEFGTPHRVWLCAEQGELTVFVVRAENDEDLWFVTNTDQTWGTVASVPGLDGASVVDVLLVDGATLVLSKPPGEGDASSGLRLSRLESGHWVTRELRGMPGRNGVDRMDAALGDRLALGFVVREADEPGLQVGLWSVAGELVEAPTTVKALLTPRGFQLNRRLQLAIPYGVLTILLAGVLIRRRRAIVEPPFLRENQAIVGVGRRAAAFVVDVLLVLPLMYPFLRPHVAVLQAHIDSAIPPEAAVMALSFGWFWHWLAAAGVFVAYCTVFEATAAATPGKMFMHCRVVDERGEACRFPRIVIRNLLRLVEMFPAFDLLPPLVLILVTRKRQRLGDLLAGTIVIEQQGGARVDRAGRRTDSSENNDDSNRDS